MIRIQPIVYSRFLSDGGAMFGLVPRPIWSRLIAPNEQNGIPQNANGLLITLADGRRGIIDTGCGDPMGYSEKSRQVHGLERDWLLPQHLLRLGVSPEAIDFVVFTHLHWDHAGGVVWPDGREVFPNATFYIHEKEWEDAISGNPLLYKSYPPETIAPLRHHPRRTLVRGDQQDVLPGVRMMRTGGHTRGHCAVLLGQCTFVESAQPGTHRVFPGIVYAGDVCPTRHHLRLVFQAAYDTFPLETRHWKHTWLPHCAENRIPVFFSHDPECCGALLAADERHGVVTSETFRSPESWTATPSPSSPS
jgi:glyoxylase-like metal-dependent hydrolase (beta-lactamase superfamily II)